MVNTVSHYVEQQVHVHPADGAVDWLQRRAHLSPQRIALIDSATHQQITFAQWNQRANRVANALHGLGCAKAIVWQFWHPIPWSIWICSLPARKRG